VTASLTNLVATYGLIAIFVTMAGESAGLPISSEIVVPLGGALAVQSKLGFGGGPVSLVVVVLVCSVANLAGSLVAFYLTRRYGERVVLSRAGRWMGLSRGHLRLANRFFDRFGLWAVFAGRLLPIVRTYISFPAGLSKIGYVKFTLATMAGAIPWNFALGYAGYKLGQHYETVAATLGPFAIPIAIVVVILLGVAWWFGRRMGEDEEDAIQEEERALGRKSRRGKA
jgi:membrane protein DedA with SNARE-associated domain